MPDPLYPIREDEIEFSAIRAQGAGGQNVNKVSNAVHLRYSIPGSTLPDDIKQRLLQLSDQRITQDGVVVIKAQSSRSLEQNRQAAMERLQALVDSVALPPKPRRATRPTRSSQIERLDTKTERSNVKKQRQRVSDAD